MSKQPPAYITGVYCTYCKKVCTKHRLLDVGDGFYLVDTDDEEEEKKKEDEQFEVMESIAKKLKEDEETDTDDSDDEDGKDDDEEYGYHDNKCPLCPRLVCNAHYPILQQRARLLNDSYLNVGDRFDCWTLKNHPNSFRLGRKKFNLVKYAWIMHHKRRPVGNVYHRDSDVVCGNPVHLFDDGISKRKRRRMEEERKTEGEEERTTEDEILQLPKPSSPWRVDEKIDEPLPEPEKKSLCPYCNQSDCKVEKHRTMLDERCVEFFGKLKNTDNPDKCWTMDESKHKNCFQISHRKMKVGRYAFCLHHKRLPNGTVCHLPSLLPEAKLCGNPSHLIEVNRSGAKSGRPCPICTWPACTRHQTAEERGWWQEILQTVSIFDDRPRPIVLDLNEDVFPCWPSREWCNEWWPSGFVEKRGEKWARLNLSEIAYRMFFHKDLPRNSSQSGRCQHDCINPFHMGEYGLGGYQIQWLITHYPHIRF